MANTATPAWRTLLLDRAAKMSSPPALVSAAPVSAPSPDLAAPAAPAAPRVLTQLEEAHESLTLALTWLEQAISGIPQRDETIPQTAQLRAHVKDLGDVRDALARVQHAAHAEALTPLLVEGTPLVEYLEGVYDGCEKLLATFEAHARGLRRGEPIQAVFDHRTVNRSFARFDRLTEEIHADVERLRARSRGRSDAFARLDPRLEELFWAASWLHVSLAKRLGD